MYWLIILYSFLMATSSNGQYDKDCLLPNQESGRCVPIKSCKTTWWQPTNSQRDDLLSLQCGYLKNVYVPDVRNRGEIAVVLVLLKSCKNCLLILKLLKPLVCCDESKIQLNVDGLNALEKNTCGIYSINKVSNGKEAALFGFPWMALLKYNDDLSPYKCGASIISDRYILTAAHCVYNLEPILDVVRLGEHRISTPIDCIKTPRKDICAPPVEDVGIEEIIIHEKYARNFYHDIALIRLNRTIKFQRHIKPICLPIYDNIRNKAYSEYVISGWGTTEKGATSDVLLVAVVPFSNHIDCHQTLKAEGLRLPLTPGQICAGGTDAVDTCRGDSGGPLGYSDFYNGRPRFIQFGVVSFGLPSCGIKNAPTLYTNTSHYLQWITDHIR